MERALFIGRFQPFHLGHMAAVNEISLKYEVLLAVGSAQESYSFSNPFTAGERIDMLLKIRGLKALCMPVPDITNNSLWVSHVKSLLPKFNVVFSANPLVAALFEDAGFKVEKQTLFNPEIYSGTQIRKKIASGGEWKNLVPSEVYEYIKSIGGEKRIRNLSLKEI